MSLAPRADFVCFRCEEKEPGTGGPFLNLPLPKPACPNCRARRWMQRQWSGYSVNTFVKNGGEALPRMSHDDIKGIDALTKPQIEKYEATKGPFAARAVPLGGVAKEVQSIAGGNATVALPSLKDRAQVSGPALGQQSRLLGGAKVQLPDRRNLTHVAGRWNPSQADVAEAVK